MIGRQIPRVTPLCVPVRKLGVLAEYLHCLLPLGRYQGSAVPFAVILYLG